MERADLNTVSGFAVVVEESLSVHLEGHIEEPVFEVDLFEKIERDGCGARLVFNGLVFDLLVSEWPALIASRTPTAEEKEIEGLLVDAIVGGCEFLADTEDEGIAYEICPFAEVAREGAGVRAWIGDRVFDVVIVEAK